MTEEASKAWRELIREATMAFLAGLTMALICYFVWSVLTNPIPARNENLAFAVLGIVGGTMVGGIFGAYFGIQLSHSRPTKPSDSVTVQAPQGATTTVETPQEPRP